MIAPLRNLYRRFAVKGPVTTGRGLHIGFGTLIESARGLDIGTDVYIGKYCTIGCDGRIGDWCLIANSVGLVGRYDHDFRTPGVPIRRSSWTGDKDFPERLMRPLIVEDDVWIGYGAIVISGITVGRGAVVGAGAVVTTDVAPYAVVAGNPARAVGMRFTPEEIVTHERRLYGAPRV